MNNRELKEKRDLLKERWYQSLADGKPDYGIYSHPLYIAEAWFCWNEYSRKYLKAIDGMKPLLNIPRQGTVVDVGCGIGYSTWRLKEMFPEATVIGTQVPGQQFDIAKGHGDRHGFTVTESAIVDADLVFASEYFEHFDHPLDQLDALHISLHPKVWVIANTFTSEAPGHFPAYRVNGDAVPGTKMALRFSRRMKELGYERLETGFWNNRPAVWRRI